VIVVTYECTSNESKTKVRFSRELHATITLINTPCADDRYHSIRNSNRWGYEVRREYMTVASPYDKIRTSTLQEKLSTVSTSYSRLETT
jgi:hypothetical protein